MAARWLVVKVLDDEHFEAQFRLNQLDGVDCMEVTPAQAFFRDMVDNFDEDPNRSTT